MEGRPRERPALLYVARRYVRRRYVRRCYVPARRKPASIHRPVGSRRTRSGCASASVRPSTRVPVVRASTSSVFGMSAHAGTGNTEISDTTSSVVLSLAVLGGVIALDTRRTVRVEGERIEGELSQAQVDGT